MLSIQGALASQVLAPVYTHVIVLGEVDDAVDCPVREQVLMNEQ
jgi:hypothetical protein